MSDSSSYSSLFALVDSHLSKTQVQGSRSENTGNSINGIQIPSLGNRNSTQSETSLSLSPAQRFPIPSFNLGESPIANVLAQQVANMLKAKEEKKKEEEEKQKLADELKKVSLKDDDYIDLVKAIQNPHSLSQNYVQEVISSSSSMESLLEAKFVTSDEEAEDALAKTPEPVLPCITDMRYILREKIPRGKCSPFGRVVVSRLMPVAAPYLSLRTKYPHNIKRFDFKTKSPCDLIKEKLRQPCTYNSYPFDIMAQFK